MEFSNVYEDNRRAEAYDKLEFPGTYYLAYRDLPSIFEAHVAGWVALDFGCGTGRSTRFLQRLGFTVTGTDISAEMLDRARTRDPRGEYVRIDDGDLCAVEPRTFDLILAAFTFDNIPTFERKVIAFDALRKLLRPGGRIVTVVSSPEIYTHEWASFTTKAFPENAAARCGDTVRIIMTDVDDGRPVEDVVWPDKDYRRVYDSAGLDVIGMFKPLAHEDEPFQWVSETTVPPWVIYILGARA